MDALGTWLGDIRQVLPPPFGEFILIVVSTICGGMVGAERERAEKPAGLRTLLLICLGSTIFTLMSMDPALQPSDRTRIAAQIVTGIGFLGAGAILRERGGVVGLTTAASIWVVAAVGIVVGAGYAVAGLLLAGAIVLMLILLSRIEERYLGRCEMTGLRVLYHPREGKTRMRIQGILDSFAVPLAVRRELVHAPERHEIDLKYCRSHRAHRAFLGDLANLHEVERIDSEQPLLDAGRTAEH